MTKIEQSAEPVTPDSWVVPGVVLAGTVRRMPAGKGDCLLWSYSGAGRRRVGASPAILNEFMALADGPADDIVKFARRYGVLCICEAHTLPSSHIVATEPLNNDDLRRRGWFGRCPLLEMKPGLYLEPLESWRRYARQVRALLNLVPDLRQRRNGRREDWEALYPEDPDPPPSYRDGRLFVGLFIDGWLQYGAVQPRFLWPDLGPQVSFASPNLFGNLAIQLLLAMRRTKAFLTCDECGTLCIPSREPKPGQRNFCARCGRRAASRQAQRDRRQRERLAPAAHTPG